MRRSGHFPEEGRTFPSLAAGGAVLLLPLLVLAGCGGGSSPEVTIENRPIVKSNYDFTAENWQEEKLRTLREREDLASLEGGSQFDFFLAACDWTHRQWQEGIPDPYPLCNALDILDDIRSGKTGGFCGQYAYVLADVLKASGYFSVRYVELWRQGDDSHFVVEAWSDEHGKWMVLDPYQNIFYLLAESGLPASAGEVRRSLYGGEGIRVATPGSAEPIFGEGPASYYRHFAVSLRSDLMRHTRPLTVDDRFDTFLYYHDEHTDFPPGVPVPYRNTTSRWEDIYFDCNRVRVEHRAEGDAVTLDLFTDASMANFSHFVMKSDVSDSWYTVPSRLVIDRAKGIGSLEVAAVNHFQRRGASTGVTIAW